LCAQSVGGSISPGVEGGRKEKGRFGQRRINPQQKGSPYFFAKGVSTHVQMVSEEKEGQERVSVQRGEAKKRSRENLHLLCEGDVKGSCKNPQNLP